MTTVTTVNHPPPQSTPYPPPPPNPYQAPQQTYPAPGQMMVPVDIDGYGIPDIMVPTQQQ